MSELNEPAPAARRNPLMWITLIVIGLILFVFLSGEREDVLPRVQVDAVEPVVEGHVAEEFVAREGAAETGKNEGPQGEPKRNAWGMLLILR